MPLTEGQLRSKRDEFWDTAPAFEGRKEIWDALRAATSAAEALDFQLAQAILDGANISVPNGYLTECYDELGSQYKLPIYCLSYPVNVVKEDYGCDSPAEYSEPVDGGKCDGRSKIWSYGAVAKNVVYLPFPFRYGSDSKASPIVDVHRR